MHSANIVGIQMDAMFELYLPEYTVPTPEVQTNYKEIPYRDGSIDKTEQYGVVYYKDREWNLVFKKTGKNVSGYDLPKLAAELYNYIHGRRGNVIFDDDPTYKWIGRVFVDNVSCENNGLLIATMRFISEPYKYKVIDIEKTLTLSSSSQNVVLHNGRKPIVPTVVVSAGGNASLAFTVKGVSYTATLSAGEQKVADLVLFEGDTVVSCTGSGTIKFSYVEASL